MTPAETLETIQHNITTITNKHTHTRWGDPDHTIIITLEKLHHILEKYSTQEPVLVLHLLQAHFVTLSDNTIKNNPNTTGELSEIQEFIIEQYLLSQFAVGNIS